MKNIYISRVEGKVVLSPSILTFNIEIEDNFNTSKVIEVENGTIQKTNDKGELLYKSNIIKDDLGIETFEETTEPKTVTKYEEKQVTNKWFDEQGTEHSETVTVKEPIEWIDNKPIMVPNMVKKTVNFSDHPTEFNVNEILNAKYQNLLNNTGYDYILADIFLNEDDIDLSYENHSANTGVAIMELLPHGQAKTKEITLNKTAKDFLLLEFEGNNIDIYVNNVKIIDKKVTLDVDTNKIYLKFANTTDKPISIKSYAFAY